VIGFLKGLFILLLAAAVFGGGGYFTYQLYIHPEIELQQEKNSPARPAPALQDPTVAEYQKCLQTEAAGDPLAARRSYSDFLDAYPDSSKAEEARYRLGAIQSGLLLTPRPSPDKLAYTVRSGDVLNKLANRLKTSPDLLLEINQLETVNLRVGQRIFYAEANFSVTIDRVAAKVVVQRDHTFFCQFPIVTTLGNARIGPVKKGSAPPLSAKVQDKPSWKEGQRLSFGEKGYREATRWIVLQPAGHTLFENEADSAQGAPKPPSGYGLDPEAVRILSALLRKGDAVTIR
jgi:LysM repeat protein